MPETQIKVGRYSGARRRRPHGSDVKWIATVATRGLPEDLSTRTAPLRPETTPADSPLQAVFLPPCHMADLQGQMRVDVPIKEQHIGGAKVAFHVS